MNPPDNDIRAIFSPVRRAEWWFWGLALAALVLQVIPASRRVYLDVFAVPGLDPQLAAWESILWHHGSTFLVFLLPLLLMRRLGIHAQGLSLFRPGDWRWGLKWTLIACAVVTVPTWISSHDPQMQLEYPLAMRAFDSAGLFALFLASYLLYYIGWEAFFRGFIGFGMTGLGYTPFLAMMVQVSLSTLIHIGKPDAELTGAIVGGVLMGVLALRSRSLIWPLLFHFYIGTLNTLFCWLNR